MNFYYVTMFRDMGEIYGRIAHKSIIIYIENFQ